MNCKELLMSNKGHMTNYPILHNILKHESITVLGITLHLKGIFYEAIKCLYVIRSLRKERYSHIVVIIFFKSIVLPNITYGLPGYGASGSNLSTGKTL